MRMWHKDVDKKLDAFNAKYEGHGVEAIRACDIWDSYFGNTALLYVNMGDTYVKTYAYCPETEKFYRGDLEELLLKRIPKKLLKKIEGWR